MKRLYLASKVLLCVIFLQTGCSDTQNEQSLPVSMPQVSLAEVKTGSRFSERRYLGQIRAKSQGELSFEIAGNVTVLPVEVGDQFFKGQVLAELDAEITALSLAEVEADLNRAEFDFDNAQLELQRRKKLYKQSLVSAAEVDSWKLRADTTEAQIKLLQARRDTARRRNQDTQILAPYDGTVTQRHVEVNENTSSGQPIISVVSIQSALEVQTHLPYQHVTRDMRGETVAIETLDNQSVSGVITSVNGSADNNALVDVLIEVKPGSAPLVSPGVPVDVIFRVENKAHSFLLPTEGLHRSPTGEHFVWLVNKPDSTAVKTPVEIARFYGDKVLVFGEVAAGDAIVTSAAKTLDPGVKVHAVNL